MLILYRKIPLIFLFLLAGLVIGITIVRLPLILNQSLSQHSRSMVSHFSSEEHFKYAYSRYSSGHLSRFFARVLWRTLRSSTHSSRSFNEVTTHAWEVHQTTFLKIVFTSKVYLLYQEELHQEATRSQIANLAQEACLLVYSQ